MIGKLLCRLDLHKWRNDGADPVPRYCARCGWGPLVDNSPITDPDDYRIYGDRFRRCELLLQIRRPELADEFRHLGCKAFNEWSGFLEKHFPLKEGCWGTRLVVDVYDDLKAQMDGKL